MATSARPDSRNRVGFLLRSGRASATAATATAGKRRRRPRTGCRTRGVRKCFVDRRYYVVASHPIILVMKLFAIFLIQFLSIQF